MMSKEQFLSCSDDSTVKLWNPDRKDNICKFVGNSPFKAVDCHYYQNVFASSGQDIDIWNYERSVQFNNLNREVIHYQLLDSMLLNKAYWDHMEMIEALYVLRMSTPLSKGDFRHEIKCIVMESNGSI